MSNRPHITTGRIARNHPLARLAMAAAVLFAAVTVGSALAAPAAAEPGEFLNETTNGTASDNISDVMPAFDEDEDEVGDVMPALDRDDNRPMMPALEEDEDEVGEMMPALDQDEDEAGDTARSSLGSQWDANNSATPGDFTTAPETG